MPQIVCRTPELPAIAAEFIGVALRDAVTERARGSIALAGGTTPRATYEVLATISGIAWTAISVYFGDERAVPPDHPDSNYLMAKRVLLDRVQIPTAQVHRMLAEQLDADAAARAYEALLPDRLDVLVLGIGEDGHTASLFPGDVALSERERKVLPVIGPKPPPRRLTITPRVIETARSCVVLASGASKATQVARALEGETPIELCPARLMRGATWILDHAAAAELHSR